MSQASGISCGVTFFWNPEQQTTLSLGLRVTAAILGIILIIGGILNLCGVTGLSQLGAPFGWTVFSLGLFIILVAGILKCIKRQGSNGEEIRTESNGVATTLPRQVSDFTEALSAGLSTKMSDIVNQKQIQKCKVFVDVKQDENIIFTKDYIISNLPNMTVKQTKSYISKNIISEITASFSQDASKKMQMSWGVLTANPENTDEKFNFLSLSLEFDLLSTDFTGGRVALEGATLGRVHDYLLLANPGRAKPEM